MSKLHGIFICEINEHRDLDDTRTWLNLTVTSRPINQKVDSIFIIVENTHGYEFSDVLQMAITYHDGVLTKWEVLA